MDDNKALVERLRSTYQKPVVIGDGIVTPARVSACAVTTRPVNPDGFEAADALEAALAEVERLREALIELEPLLQKLHDNNKIISETVRALGDTHDPGGR